jgi:peroxiredoxin
MLSLPKIKRTIFTFKLLKSTVINIVLFAIIFNTVSFFRESSLLPSDSTVAAPSLTLPSMKGEMFEHSELAGKNTVVYFFAPWCHVCHASIGNLEDFYQDKKGDVNVVAVALSYDSRNEIAEFVADKQLSFPVLLGTNELMSEYQINGFPSYYVLDGDGIIIAKSQGYSTELGIRLRAM